MVLSGFFSRHLLWGLIPAPGGLSRWEIPFQSPILGSSSRTGNPLALVRSLFIPSVWLGTWSRGGAPPTLAEGREQIWRPRPVLCLVQPRSDSGASPSLLSSDLCSQPLSKPPDSQPLGPLCDSANVFARGAAAPQPSGTLRKCSG